ncbi:hypothetical protein ACI3RH_14000 [Lactococcus lactis]
MSLDQFKNQREIISQQILGTAVNTLFFGVLAATSAISNFELKISAKR